MLESQFAWYLEDLKQWGTIYDWLYEPKIFYFNNIKSGTRAYKPDFYIKRSDNTLVWVECKGYMCPKSKTKLKRFLRYHPSHNIILVRTKKDFMKIGVDDPAPFYLKKSDL